MSQRGAKPILKRFSKRGAVQWVALIGFLLLYARTAYRGADEITWPVHLVFRLDPLAMLTELLAVGAESTFILHWLGALFLLGLTLVLGRFFCGWLCPMGTLLEFAGPFIRRAGKRTPPFSRPPTLLPVAVLTALVTATALGLPLLGFFDPLSILLRSLTVAIFPAFDHGVKESFAVLFGLDSAAVNAVADPLYGWLSEWFLAFGRPLFLVSGVTAALFGALFALELLAPRFWCAHLCPLGALLGVAARLGWAKRSRAEECGKCSLCVSNCPTSALGQGEAEALICIHCNTCASDCPQGAMTLAPGGFASVSSVKAPATVASVVPVRRVVLGSIVAGAALAAFGRARAGEKRHEWGFLRPPGSVEDEEFNRRCIRCGACMRVCPGTALHPSFAEAGLGGIWTPRLVPRVGYCEYHCRLCGQVCPTGAITHLSEGKKEKWIIGIAVLDKNHCLPYRSATGCIVCEEHCPTSPKAILFEEREGVDAQGRTVLLKYPKVVEERCIGCGICENKCPLEGRSAIVVGREVPASGKTTLGY